MPKFSSIFDALYRKILRIRSIVRSWNWEDMMQTNKQIVYSHRTRYSHCRAGTFLRRVHHALHQGVCNIKYCWLQGCRYTLRVSWYVHECWSFLCVLLHKSVATWQLDLRHTVAYVILYPIRISFHAIVELRSQSEVFILGDLVHKSPNAAAVLERGLAWTGSRFELRMDYPDGHRLCGQTVGLVRVGRTIEYTYLWDTVDLFRIGKTF